MEVKQHQFGHLLDLLDCLLESILVHTGFCDKRKHCFQVHHFVVAACCEPNICWLVTCINMLKHDSPLGGASNGNQLLIIENQYFSNAERHLGTRPES
jgi:hypothetical protein